MSEANRLYFAANYQAARGAYARGLDSPELTPRDRADFLLGIGNCDQAIHRYEEALQSYADAAAVAQKAGLERVLIGVAVNRASIYRRMNNRWAAVQAMEGVQPLVSKTREPLALAQVANVTRDIDSDRAMMLYQTAIRHAVKMRDRLSEAAVWNQLGYTLLSRGDLVKAEHAFTEALRLKTSHGSRQTQTTLFYLARLKRLQGDSASALKLLDEARQDSDHQIPNSALHCERGLLLRDRLDLRGARQEFDTALRHAREWRVKAVPTESFRLSTEADLQQIYRGYLETIMAQYESSRSRELAALALALAEEHRSAVFEGSLAAQRQYPPEYWEILAKYQRTLGQSAGAPTPESARLMAEYRLRLDEIEVGLGSSENSHQINENTGYGFALHRLQTNLKGTEALLSFYTGDSASYRWAVTAKQFEVHRLPPRREIAERVKRFREAIQAGTEDTEAAGAELYSMLFGGLGAEAESRQAWILSLDGPLFELPLPALCIRKSGNLEYLVEKHSLRLTASTAAKSQRRKSLGGSGRFVGLGDPIYNVADSRWGGSRRDVSVIGQMARIPGTATEIRRCALAWGRDSDPVLLTGQAISRESLENALRVRPAVLHVATHVVRNPNLPDQVLLAVGLRNTGDQEYLGPVEISAGRRPVGLVTLSGCGSGQGAVLPGLGLFGLTRAWLVSGAEAVLATHWPVGDSDGRLLATMYARLREERRPLSSGTVAEALRQAQLNALRTGGSRQAQWAAYFLVGKD